MTVSNELTRPETEEEFEVMCHALYRRMWNDTGCVRVGGSGQAQFGVDILGHDGAKAVGIQCKHYNKKPFTLSTVTGDIKKAEDSGLEIEHLLFATTASSKSGLVKEVYDLSAKRRREGKFTVSVDFWGEISGHIRLHPEIGKAFIRDFPGSTLLDIKGTIEEHVELYQLDRDGSHNFQATSLELHNKVLEQVTALAERNSIPAARGDEADAHVVAVLDLARDRLRAGKSGEASDLLGGLGDPSNFKDQFSRFRWHTNHATVALLEGRYEDAAEEFLIAFDLAPDNEKACANRVHALILRKDANAALAACDESLERFPGNVHLWSLKLNARNLLGDPKPDRDIPASLIDSPEILYTRAHLCDSRGDYPGALQFLQECLAKDSGSFEARRAYLADALSWAAQDPVLAHHGQMTNEQRKVLVDALNRLEPLESTLPKIQSDYISLEVTNNVTLSLILLGNKDRARAIASNALARHPLSEGLLRTRLDELDERNDIAAIHNLVDPRLPELPAAVLGILAEISANRSDVAWHADIMGLVEKSGIDPNRLRDLRVLSAHVLWNSGDHDRAIQAVRDHVCGNPDHIFARIFLGQMLRRSGKHRDAEKEALICFSSISEQFSSLEFLHLADLLYDLRLFRQAGIVYARLCKVKGDDDITRRFLISLVESDQRRLAQEQIEQLPPAIRSLSVYRRIEANLASRTGDWGRMRDLLALEIKDYPANSRAALGYVGALYRLDDSESRETLVTYLSSDPVFKDASFEDEFEFAKYQRNHGLAGLSVARLYRLYRTNPHDTQVASYYLSNILLGDRIPELDAPEQAGPSAVVFLKSTTGTRAVAIDVQPTYDSGGWPELVSSTSEQAKHLLGLKVGDKVTVPGLLVDNEEEIVGIGSLFEYVAQKAHDQISGAAVPRGPLWSVRVIKEDGELNVDLLRKSVEKRQSQVRLAFDGYKQHRFPVSVLAKLIGSDTVSLLIDWPYKEVSLFVGLGTQEERDAAVGLIREGLHRYVMDLLTLAELLRQGCFDAVVSLLGVPLVPETVREHLKILLQFADKEYGVATLGAQDGDLIYNEIPDGLGAAREHFLHDLLKAIDEKCEVVPTLGPHQISDQLLSLSYSLDNDTLDALYLCAERDAILVSEDAALRLHAVSAGVPLSMGVQPILMEACDQGLLNCETYTDVVSRKILAGHEFVWVRASELLALAMRAGNVLSEEVLSILETFRKPSLDIASGFRVGAEFVHEIIRRLRPNIAAQYGEYVLDVLQHGRPEISDEIHRELEAVVVYALRNARHQASPKELRAFSRLLSAPERPVPKLTRIASSVRKILRSRD